MNIVLSHALASAAFLALALWVLPRVRRGGFFVSLLIASFAESLWAALVAANVNEGGSWAIHLPIPEASRSLAWIGVLIVGLRSILPDGAWRVALAGAGVTIAASLTAIAASVWWPDSELLRGTGFLLLALLGLVLTENLFRNSRPERRWAMKYLCFGIGGLFAYDLYLYADMLLFRGMSVALVEARGAVNILLVPLAALSVDRRPLGSGEVTLSRRAVFHTAAIIGAGLYLLAMSAAGYYLRRFGGTWGGLLQTTFLAGSLTLLFVVLFSGTAQSWLRRLISRNFFQYKYDYREEWLRFTNIVGAADPAVPIGPRVVEAIAGLVDSPGGAVWVYRADAAGFALTDRWNFLPDGAGDIPDPHPFTQRLKHLDRVLDLDEVRRLDRPPEDLPGWLLHCDEARLLVPLIHHRGVFGAVVLQQPRVGRDFDWEDHDLLVTAGRQAAAYLAEREVQESLEAARRMEEFNRRFAFVIHDLKNMASQLSLILSNAKEHGDNPEFQADVLATVQSSVDRMNRLLVQMHRKKGEQAPSEIALEPLLRRLTLQVLPSKVDASLESIDSDLRLQTDAERLSNALDLLVRNAAEAAGDGGKIRLRAARTTEGVLIEVEDDGPGMDPEFVRKELFVPLRSTKSGGYGIGAYQSRELIRELGGRLDVVSVPGSGTTMRILLPTPDAPAVPGEPKRASGL